MTTEPPSDSVDEDPRRVSVVDHTAWLGIGYALLGIAIGIALALR